jgi:hypothetical protein
MQSQIYTRLNTNLRAKVTWPIADICCSCALPHHVHLSLSLTQIMFPHRNQQWKLSNNNLIVWGWAKGFFSRSKFLETVCKHFATRVTNPWHLPKKNWTRKDILKGQWISNPWFCLIACVGFLQLLKKWHHLALFSLPSTWATSNNQASNLYITMQLQTRNDNMNWIWLDTIWQYLELERTIYIEGSFIYKWEGFESCLDVETIILLCEEALQSLL